tara:strand:+ start:690 stop:1094 length:405 start_codon:yes stop_codon:yes gene_type:complete
MSTYWINNSSLEEYNKIIIQKKTQFFDVKYKNKISRMKNGDKIIYFLNDKDSFIGISEIKSDNYKVINNNLISIKINKNTHLKLKDSIDANQIGPSLEYVKRWAPEKWKLSLFGKLHIISQNDFNFIQSCIEKK